MDIPATCDAVRVSTVRLCSGEIMCAADALKIVFSCTSPTSFVEAGRPSNGLDSKELRVSGGSRAATAGEGPDMVGEQQETNQKRRNFTPQSSNSTAALPSKEKTTSSIPAKTHKCTGRVHEEEISATVQPVPISCDRDATLVELVPGAAASQVLVTLTGS